MPLLVPSATGLANSGKRQVDGRPRRPARSTRAKSGVAMPACRTTVLVRFLCRASESTSGSENV